MNVKYFCDANGETGYHAHSKAFWSRLESKVIHKDGIDVNFIDGKGVPINIVLETSNHPAFYEQYNGVKICYNVYESTLQPDHFFKHIRNKWDYFWCPTTWQAECTVAQGFPAERVMVVPEGVSNEFMPVNDHELDEVFTFMITGKWEYRKATEEMIQAWLEEFPLINYPTGIRLVLSVDNPFDRANVERKLKELEKLNDPRIEIIHFPPREEYISRLQKCHVFMSCARSEGWNLPLIEAIACGVPTICSNYSGQLDFAKDISHLVDIKGMKPIPGGAFPGEYAEPDFNHFKQILRYISENWQDCRKRALIGSNFIRQQFSWKKAVDVAVEYLKQIEEKHKDDKYEDNILPITGEANVNFIDGAIFNLKNDTGKEYNIKFINRANNSLVYQTKMTPTKDAGFCWAKPTPKYFVDWKIEARRQIFSETSNFNDQNTMIIKSPENNNNFKEEVFIHNFNPTDKIIYINIDSKAIGDTLAWIPYADLFQKRWNCEAVVSTFWNNLFKDVYPNLHFVEPGTVVNNLYAQYKVGCFDNDYSRNKINWREIPLQKVATDILGLPFVEVKPKISVKKKTPLLTGRKYVVIGNQSTMAAKHWNYQNGWQEIVDYLYDKAYNVITISKTPTELTRVIPVFDRSIDDIIPILNGCEFFIGVGSGLSWLSWALNKKVIMISGFSEPFAEFITDNYRLSPPAGVCHGCFNDPKLNFDRSWEWCPTHSDYACSKSITPNMVKEKIDLIIKHLQENE